MSRLGQHDVGHEGFITGRDALSLRSSISLIPKESPSRNEDQLIYMAYVFYKCHSTLADEPKVLSLAIKRMSIFDDPL